MKEYYYCYFPITKDYLLSKGFIPISSGINVNSKSPYWVFRWSTELENNYYKIADMEDKRDYFFCDSANIYIFLTEINCIEPEDEFYRENKKWIIYRKTPNVISLLKDWAANKINPAGEIIIHSERVKDYFTSHYIYPIRELVTNISNLPIWVYKISDELTEARNEYQTIKKDINIPSYRLIFSQRVFEFLTENGLNHITIRPDRKNVGQVWVFFNTPELEKLLYQWTIDHWEKEIANNE